MDDQQDDAEYSIEEKLLVLDNDLCVIDASPAFYKAFGLPPEETVNRPLSELANGQWHVPELLFQLSELAPVNGRFEGFELVADFPVIGTKHFLLSARRSSNRSDGAGTILLGIDDITNAPAVRAVQPLMPPMISDVDSPVG